jgi:alkaline phosphatase D
MPLRASVLMDGLAGLEKGAEMRIYRNYRFGNILNMSVLDTRQYRDVQACTVGGNPGSSAVDPNTCGSLASDARTMLGAQQEQWLLKQLEDSADQTWTVIAQATLFGPRVYRTATGTRVWNDGWDGYPATRKRIVDGLLARKVTNPVVFGGDVHESWVGYIKEDYANPNSKVVGFEFCGTSITSGDGKSTSDRQRDNPHFIHSEGLRRGYTVAEFTRDDLIVNLRAVADHRARKSTIETLATFRMANGSKQLEVLRT